MYMLNLGVCFPWCWLQPYTQRIALRNEAVRALWAFSEQNRKDMTDDVQT